MLHEVEEGVRVMLEFPGESKRSHDLQSLTSLWNNRLQLVQVTTTVGIVHLRCRTNHWESFTVVGSKWELESNRTSV